MNRAISVFLFLIVTGVTIFFVRAEEKPPRSAETVAGAPAAAITVESTAAPSTAKSATVPEGERKDVLAFTLSRERKYPQAAELLKEHLKTNPNDEKALEELGRILSRNLGEPKSALEYLERAVAVNPENNRALNEMLQIYTKQNEPAEAEDKFAALLKEHPASAAIHETLGALQARTGKLDEARGSLEKAAKLSASPEYPLTTLAETYAFNGNPARAAKTYDRVIGVLEKKMALAKEADEIRSLEIEKAMAQLDLADALIAQKQFSAAERLLEDVRAKHAHAPVDALWRKMELTQRTN